jgi:4-amino-4-deoxy-L-arabinose transferase-like glycosyltransferase
LVLVHLVVAFLVRPYPRWNDGIYVLNDARSFPDVPLDHHALRIGNLLPTRAFLEIFGYGQVAYYSWPFLTGILLVVATFALGTVLFGRLTGAAAALLIVFHPVLVDTEIRPGVERMASWQLLPDIPSAAFLTAGFALMIGAAQRRSSEDGDRDGGPTWWYVLAGLCFGWAYLVRELSVFAFPVILGVLIAWRLPLRRWVQVSAPMLGCLVLEMILAAAVHGDALARLHVGAEHGISPRIEIDRFDALMRLPRAVIAYPQTVVVLTSIVLTVLGALFIRRRGTVMMLGWVVSVWLPLTLVSGLLNPDYIRINASLMRYWIPIFPPLCIGAAAAVAALLHAVRRRAPEGAQRRVALGCALVAVAALAAWIVPITDEIADNPRDAIWNSLRTHLTANDATVDKVITDDRTALILGIYQHEPIGGDEVWQAEIEAVPHSQPEAPETEGPGTELLWTPQMTRRPPGPDSGWTLVFQRPGLRLYAPSTSG